MIRSLLGATAAAAPAFGAELEAVRREQIVPLPFLFEGQVDNSVTPF